MSEEATLDEFADSEEVNQEESQELFGLGQMPSDWDIKSLSDTAEIIPGNSPPSSTYNDNGDGLPFFQGNSNFGHFHPEADTWCTEPRKVAQPNDVLISIRAPVGDLNITEIKSCIGRGLAAIRPNGLNGLYLYYNLGERNTWLSRLATGSTFKAINKSDLQLLNIPTPPLPEQHKIATVLYTVDRAIEKTEEIIEQYRRIYAGLLQSEFHGGSEDETKDAGALGRVPASWSVVPISEVAEVTMGNSPRSEHYNSEGDGLPFYQGANEFGERSPTPDRWCSAPKKVGKPGDTLLNIRSHTNVGKVNKAHHECCIGRGLAAITPGEKIDEDYLYHHLRERENYINSIASGSTFDSVNTEEVESVKITLPPMDTQQKIASSLSNIQNGILKQKEIVEKFDRVKRGLMQDLLSGTVRTTDTNIEVPDEIAQHG